MITERLLGPFYVSPRLLTVPTACIAFFLLSSPANSQSIDVIYPVLNAMIDSDFVSETGSIRVIKQGESYIIRETHQSAEIVLDNDGKCSPIGGDSSPTKCEVSKYKIVIVGDNWTDTYSLLGQNIIQDDQTTSWSPPVKYIYRRAGTATAASLAKDQSTLEYQVHQNRQIQDAKDEKEEQERIEQKRIERQQLENARLEGIARSIRRSGTTNESSSSVQQSSGYAYCKSLNASGNSYFSAIFPKPASWAYGAGASVGFRAYTGSRYDDPGINVSCSFENTKGEATADRDQWIASARYHSNAVLTDWAYER